MNKHLRPYGEGTCVLDALKVALGKEAGELEKELKAYGPIIENEAVWGRYLLDRGFHRVDLPPIPNKPRMTVGELASSAEGRILICRGAAHIVAIKDGFSHDSSDSSDMCVFWYYTK